MNEHLAPIFCVVLPELLRSGSKYWVYGGVAIAGIKGKFLRPNPDVDLFVMEDDYEKIIETIAGLESKLGWTHEDKDAEKRNKRDWFAPNQNEDVLSVVPAFPAGNRIRFVFGHGSYTSQNVLTSEIRTIAGLSFVTASTALIKELFLRKAHSGPYLLDSRISKMKTDARVIMDREAYQNFCTFVESRRKKR
jgi:hypothetical protein